MILLAGRMETVMVVPAARLAGAAAPAVAAAARRGGVFGMEGFLQFGWPEVKRGSRDYRPVYAPDGPLAWAP